MSAQSPSCWGAAKRAIANINSTRFRAAFLGTAFAAASELCGARGCSAQAYTTTAIYGPNQTNAWVYHVNNSSQVVGEYYDSNTNTENGYILNQKNNHYTVVSHNDVYQTWLNSINDVGQAVGVWETTDGVLHSFLYNNGKFNSLDFDGATTTVVYDINNQGTYVGTYCKPGCKSFIYDGGYKYLRDNYIPMGINNLGDVVGVFFSDKYDGTHDCTEKGAICGFLLREGSYSKIWGPIGTLDVYTASINDAGEMAIVSGNGLYYDSDIYTTFDNGRTFQVVAYSNSASSANVNNAGAIGYSVIGGHTGFIATPNSLIQQGGKSGKPTAAKLAKIFAGAGTALDLASTVVEGSAAAEENVAVNVGVRTMEQFVQNNDEFFGTKVDLAEGIIDILGKAIKGKLRRNKEAAYLEYMAVGANSIALGTHIYSKDPPDMHYKVVAKPQSLSLPSSRNATIDQAVKDYLSFTSYTIAALHAAERYQGALLAGATTYETEQSNAYQTYSQDALTAKTALDGDNQSLLALLPKVKMKQFQGGAKALAALYHEQCGKRLPREFNEAFLQNGVPQNVIDGTVCAIAKQVTPGSLTTSFQKWLSKPAP